MQMGHRRQEATSGSALAVNHEGDAGRLNLNQIYKAAAERYGVPMSRNRHVHGLTGILRCKKKANMIRRRRCAGSPVKPCNGGQL
jgi:hypothetical protein